MTIDRGLLDKLRSRGGEVLGQLSSELMSSPRFMKAVEGAMKGREKLEEAAASALKQMNVPTRGELKRASARIDTLEREVAELRRQLRRRTPAAGKAARPGSRQGRAKGGARAE
jgi:polyhydroxyalkanoate synthesis regulator phasin